MTITATVVRGAGAITYSGTGNVVVLNEAPVVGNATVSGTVVASGLTANRVIYTNASKHLTSSAVTDTELGYVSGVTSAIQTQLNNPVTGTVATGSVSAINTTPKAMFTPIALGLGRYYVRINTYYTGFLNASTLTAYTGFATVSLNGGGGTATVAMTSGMGMCQNQMQVASVSGPSNNPVHYAQHTSATDIVFSGSVSTPSSATYTRTVWGIVDFYMDVTVAGTWAPSTSSTVFTGGAATTSAVFQKVS